ncbi:MAG: hypothetical protein ABSE08_21775 [Syntrophobacteraceae bacterium]|jgi:hypothetical protein
MDHEIWTIVQAPEHSLRELIVSKNKEIRYNAKFKAKVAPAALREESTFRGLRFIVFFEHADQVELYERRAVREVPTSPARLNDRKIDTTEELSIHAVAVWGSQAQASSLETIEYRLPDFTLVKYVL